MENTIKDAIMEAASLLILSKDEVDAAKLSQSDFAKKAGVNPSYLSNALAGKYIYQNTTIKDVFFVKVAKYVGYPLKQSFWSHVNTDQHVAIIDKLNEAREQKCFNTIIGGTGAGKSYSIRKFVEMHRSSTIVVTVNSMDDIYSIMQSISLQIGLPLGTCHRRGTWLRVVIKQIEQLAAKTPDLVLIIDEAENTKLIGLKAYKALYDNLVDLKKVCGLVLVGTPELLDIIDRFERRGKGGMAQLKRRMAAGITKLVPIAQYEQFFDQQGIDDPELRILLAKQCSNYGELHDYLERALRCANEEGRMLDNQYFRELYNI